MATRTPVNSSGGSSLERNNYISETPLGLGLSAVEWLRLYELTDSQSQQLYATLSAQSSTTLSGRQQRQISKDLSDCRDAVSRLERALAKMESSPEQYKLLDGELRRRRALFNSLQQRMAALEDVQRNGPTSAARKNLLGGDVGKRVIIEENDQTRNLANDQLYQQQQFKLKEQDQKLDGVLTGVQKLKVMSSDINSELDLHAALLDDLGEAIDHTDSRVRNNVGHIEDVQEKEGGGWCLIITMFLLLVLIVLVSATDWACRIFH